MGPVCANWKGLELLLPLPTCGLKMSTSKDHEATPSLSIWGWPGSQPAIRFPLFLKAGPPKNTLFGRNRALFPVASRSNPRCSKAQIASYLAQIRRFLAPTAWASSTSTTKKISLQATQAWFRKGSRRFWACFLGNGWKRAVAVPDMLAAPSVETIQWHTHGRNRTSTYPHTPAFWRATQLESRRPIGKHRACPEGHVTSHRFLYFWKWPAEKQLILAKWAFFPVASRSNPRCSKAQIASYWAQIGRFLALAPQRMSHLFGKDRVFFGDNVNAFNFWISLKEPIIIIS